MAENAAANIDLPLLSGAEGALAALPGRAQWLADLRSQGLGGFRSQGLPTRRTEAWKYTSVKDLTKTPFVPAPLAEDIRLDAVPAGKALDIDAHRVVFVNGRYVPELSDLDALPKGMTAVSLASALESEPETVEPYLGRLVQLEGHPFAALNTGFLGDGLVVRIREGAMIERPLHIISIAVGNEQPVAFHPRLLVVAGKDSVATIVESHIGIPGQPTFSNGVVEIDVGPGAVLQHYKVQNEEPEAVHVATMQAVVRERATYENFSLSFGGRLARNELRISLDGEHGEVRANGAYAGTGKQHLDTTSFIDHAAPHCSSVQTYKGVLDGKARGVFQGRVNVQRIAQKTDGQQLHKALLLSRGAEIDAKPELTIYADDVKCSHGAAAGELDEQALFYLRARGIAAETARALLIEGFLSEVVDTVGNQAVRASMLDLVHGWLANRSARTSEGAS